MKFKVAKLKQVQKEFEKLSSLQQHALLSDYAIIENAGIEFVKRRHLKDDLFEIKTNDVRSLFKFSKNSIIIIGLIYEKRTQKAPEFYIKLALKRLKEVK